MSDTQLFLVYTSFFTILGIFVRYILSSSFGILRPYQEGILRGYSSRAKRAMWFARTGIIVVLFLAGIIYAQMGIYCTIVYGLGYFISTFITGNMEEDLSNSEILEAATLSNVAQA